MHLVSTSLRYSLIFAVSLPLFSGPKISDSGKKIIFDSTYPGLQRFQLQTVKLAPSALYLDAPAQVVAAIKKSSILFADPDTTSLYSQYLQNNANFVRTEKNLKRIKHMFASQAATAQDLNNAENDFFTAQAANNESEGNLKAGGFSVADLKQAKQKTIWIFAEMPENQVHEAQKNGIVKATFVSFPGLTFAGKIASIGETIDPDTRTVKIRIVLDNPKDLIKPGMFATCEFMQASQSVITLPLSALVTVEQQNFVFVAQSKTDFERRAITLLSSNEKDALVSTGLKAGEQIVTSGAMLLKGLSFGY